MKEEDRGNNAPSEIGTKEK
jgi:hypothetical protein